MEILTEVGSIEIGLMETSVSYWVFGNKNGIEKDEKGKAKTRDTTNKMLIVKAKYPTGKEQDESEVISKEITEEIEYRISQVKRVFPNITTDNIDVDSFLTMARNRFSEEDC